MEHRLTWRLVNYLPDYVAGEGCASHDGMGLTSRVASAWVGRAWAAVHLDLPRGSGRRGMDTTSTAVYAAMLLTNHLFALEEGGRDVYNGLQPPGQWRRANEALTVISITGHFEQQAKMMDDAVIWVKIEVHCW